MNKFYNFINNNSVKELYLYGAIVSDKWYEDEVSFMDFRNALEEMNVNDTLNIYINSPGGEVFVTQSIISMLKRAKDTKGIKINAFLDGLAASCGSWLPMVADEIFIYQGSIMMLHKPMTSMFYANANDMRSQIELLDKLEDSEMLPMYMSKAKEGVTEERIKDILSNETWLDSTEIQELFNVTMLDTDKVMVACADRELFKNYKNVPKALLVGDKVDNKEKEVEESNKKAIEVQNKLKELEVEMCLW